MLPAPHGAGSPVVVDPAKVPEPVPALTNPPAAVEEPAVTNPAPEAVHPNPGEDWTSPAAGVEFVWIGLLKMWVGKYEVTNGEYRKMKPNHYSDVYKGQSLNGNRQPVVQVNFYRAREFAEWMTQRDLASSNLVGNMHYRVPSEEEWMAFAGCGEEREFPWGKAMPPKYGNYADGSAKASFPDWPAIAGYNDGSAVACDVEKSGKNEWGLCGVGGNVWEPVSRDAAGKFFGTWHGGSWRYDNPNFLRCAYRSARDAMSLESDFGFRLVLVCDNEEEEESEP